MRQPRPVIACSLPPGEFRTRVQWIEEVTAGSLRWFRREGLALHLAYDSAAAPAIRELVKRESFCCAFLRFAMREDDDGIHLTVTAPPETSESADALFGHFLPKQPSIRG